MNYPNVNRNLTPDEYLQKFKTPHSSISLKGNTQQDQKDVIIIKEILKKSYDDTEQSENKKQKTVLEISKIVNSWIKQVSHSMSSQFNGNLQEYGYGLRIFGSYSLRTNSIDGDIDMITIVPQCFQRQTHFFIGLVELLKKNNNIEKVFPIPQASIPLIKLTLYDVQIDLLMARIPIPFLVRNPYFFEGKQQQANSYISQKQLRIINGYRTSLYLKKNIKKQENYQVALKALKMWARNKGIYMQIHGYLGGAALSIMLAKICQLYPNYSCLQLLDRFFFIYANWVWSMPVMVEKVQHEENAQAMMTVYSPLFPHVNSAYSLTKVTSLIVRKHLRMGCKTIQDIIKKKKNWCQLFEPVNFFKIYRKFIQISVMGQNQEEFFAWKGNIESKIRKFIKFLQNQVELLQGLQINPYPNHFNSKHPNYKICCKYFIGFKCTPNSLMSDYYEIDFTQSVKNFLQLLESYPNIDKVSKEINIGFAHLTVENIPQDIKKSLKHF